MVLVLHLLLLFIYRKANAFTLQPLTLTSIVDVRYSMSARSSKLIKAENVAEESGGKKHDKCYKT